jgi:hypothetical protein
MAEMNGSNRFASAGAKQKDLQPSTNTYLADAARVVSTKFESNRLAAEGAQRATLATAREVEESEDGQLFPACTTALFCNLEFSHGNRA